MIERTLMIANRRGLHARASAKFVKCAEAYQAEIFVRKDDDVVPATSIMGLMMLGASLGSQIVLQASGSDAEA
ncbi:MAG TPA: HPr family phosphocarrier protein, partial [Rhodobiaceae bacterium]|nr:HPr family phosphocarrier protein [Rhodobiaceae bacterium]